MNRKSCMKPKRASGLPSLSRDDAQIDAESHLIRHGMKFTPVPYSGMDKVRRYRLKLEGDNDNIDEIGVLEERLRTAGLTVRMNVIENIIDLLSDIIPEYIAQTGHSLRLGNIVMLKPYATGSLSYANSSLDPEKNHVEIRAAVSPSLRYSLAKARLINGMVTQDMGMDSCCMDENGRKKDEIDDKHRMYINGHNIYIPKCTPDQSDIRGGLWLETAEGEIVGRFGVDISGPNLLRVQLKLDKRPAAGSECKVVMESYGTKEAYGKPGSPLFRYERKVRFAG